MKIGVSTACFCPELETEAAVRKIKQLGVDCADVLLRTFYEYRPEFAKAFAPDICGVDVHSVRVFPLNFEPQLFSASRRIRGDGLYWLDQIMRSAQLFGAKNYVFRGDAHTVANCGFDGLSGYMRGVIEFCARYGINVCIENSSYGLYNRPSVFGELKARCPGLGGAFSLKQARASGYPYQMYLKDMSGAISQVYLSDVGEDGKFCLPNEGITDFSELFKRLKDTGFDGAVFIENEGVGDASRLKNALEFLMETADKVK